MTRVSRKSGGNHKRKAAEPRRPKPIPCRNPELERAKRSRAEEHIAYQALMKKHRGEIPVESLFDLRAMRLQQAVSTG